MYTNGKRRLLLGTIAVHRILTPKRIQKMVGAKQSTSTFNFGNLLKNAAKLAGRNL